MTCSTFWIGRITPSDSIEVDRVHGHRFSNQLFGTPMVDGHQVASQAGRPAPSLRHPLQRDLFDTAASLLKSARRERQAWIAERAADASGTDKEPPFCQTYSLQLPDDFTADNSGEVVLDVPHADQDGRVRVVESICPFGQVRGEGQLELVGHFEITPMCLDIKQIRQTFHKINNELSVASLGIQVVMMSVERGIDAADAKTHASCQNALAAIERIAADVSDSLRKLPRHEGFGRSVGRNQK